MFRIFLGCFHSSQSNLSECAHCLYSEQNINTAKTVVNNISHFLESVCVCTLCTFTFLFSVKPVCACACGFFSLRSTSDHEQTATNHERPQRVWKQHSSLLESLLTFGRKTIGEQPDFVASVIFVRLFRTSRHGNPSCRE